MQDIGLTRCKEQFRPRRRIERVLCNQLMAGKPDKVAKNVRHWMTAAWTSAPHLIDITVPRRTYRGRDGLGVDGQCGENGKESFGEHCISWDWFLVLYGIRDKNVRVVDYSLDC
jgi:hypothetical protein